MRKLVASLLAASTPSDLIRDINTPLWVWQCRHWLSQFGNSIRAAVAITLALLCLLSVYGTDQLLADQVDLRPLLPMPSTPTLVLLAVGIQSFVLIHDARRGALEPTMPPLPSPPGGSSGDGSGGERGLSPPLGPVPAKLSAVGWVLCAVVDVCGDRGTGLPLAFLAAALGGMAVQPAWFSVHLLLIVGLSDDLQDVMRALTDKLQTLRMTALLSACVIYLFSLAAFFLFPEALYDAEEGEPGCDSLARCFAVFLHHGLLSGGGVGDYIQYNLVGAGRVSVLERA
jgi:hypothetical protein